MTHIEKSKEWLQWLRDDSGVTSYRIRQETGISETAARKFLIGESALENLRLGTAEALENLARQLREESEMKKDLQNIIAGVERGKIGLVYEWEFHEEEYTDGATDIFIVQRVVGHEDVELYFAEKKFIKEMREAVYREERTMDDLNDLLEGLNELNDQFDYDKVVAYRVDNNPIEWVQ